MTIKLVAIDIDDTLLDPHQQITALTKKAITAALDQGVKIVLCSGRPLAGVEPYIQELGISGRQQYIITYNGSIIQNAAGDILQQHTLSSSDFERLAHFCQQEQVHFNVLDDQSNIYTLDHQINYYTLLQATGIKSGLTVLTEKDLPINFTLVKGVLTGTKEQLDTIEPLLRQNFGHNYAITRSLPVMLEVAHSLATKGRALRDLSGELNLSLDEVMAIGDEQNDYTMFQTAGTAVLMGNGNNEMQDMADYITADNAHDGVAQALNEFVLH